MSGPRSIVRRRKADAPPTFPLVPHFHTCPNPAAYHRWECRNARCSWNVRVPCSDHATIV